MPDLTLNIYSDVVLHRSISRLPKLIVGLSSFEDRVVGIHLDFRGSVRPRKYQLLLNQHYIHETSYNHKGKIM